MKITLSGAARRYNFEWVFKNLNAIFESGQCVALIGHNGSGKSTLLQVLSGVLGLSEGTISFEKEGHPIDSSEVYKELVLCAPYLDLPSTFTMREVLEMHFKRKPILPNYTVDSVVEAIGLQKAANKTLNQLSSGMRQRVKLATALFADVPLILLDEPCSNLDAAGIEWYRGVVEAVKVEKLIFIASNDPQEYDFSDLSIRITDFK